MRHRAALLLHALANRLAPAHRWLPAPSPAAQVEALREEIEAEDGPIEFTPEQWARIEAAIERSRPRTFVRRLRVLR